MMASNKNGILGPLKGKIGPVVGSNWRGIPYIKSVPVRKKPPSQKELENRHIFAFTQRWLEPIKVFLKQGFNNYSQTNYGVNAAKSFLYKHALIKNGMDSRIDPSRMQVSFGDLSLPENIQIEWTKDSPDGHNDEEPKEGTLTITWDVPANRSSNDFSLNDQVMVLAYDIEEGEAHGVLHESFRKTGHQSIPLSYGAEYTYHVWVAFVSADRKRQSHSLYMGAVVHGEFQKPEQQNTDLQELAKEKEVAGV